jgi:hypothetical protein
VTVISDRDRIVQLFSEFTYILDHKEFDRLDEVFTHDVVSEVEGRPPGVGLEHRRSVVEGALTKGNFAWTHHMTGSYFVEVDGDHGTARCSVWAFHQGAGDGGRESTFQTFGEYSIDVIRTPEGWRANRFRANHIGAFQPDGEPIATGLIRASHPK